MKPLAVLALALCVIPFLRAADAPPAVAKDRGFRLNLALEDQRAGKIKAEFKTNGSPREALLVLEDLVPGTEEVKLPAVPDGTYYVYFSSPGHAPQWQRVILNAGTKEPVELKAQLFRKRYVVLRYAFNRAGGRELSGADVVEGRAAVEHWGHVPFVGGDWQVWQKPQSGGGLFGDTPFLEFHRMTKGFGFMETPKGVAFDDLKEAGEGPYKTSDRKAEKGLTLFCRVHGNSERDQGYGKLMVEEVTENPPAGIKVIERE